MLITDCFRRPLLPSSGEEAPTNNKMRDGSGTFDLTVKVYFPDDKRKMIAKLFVRDSMQSATSRTKLLLHFSCLLLSDPEQC